MWDLLVSMDDEWLCFGLKSETISYWSISVFELVIFIGGFGMLTSARVTAFLVDWLLCDCENVVHVWLTCFMTNFGTSGWSFWSLFEIFSPAIAV